MSITTWLRRFKTKPKSKIASTIAMLNSIELKNFSVYSSAASIIKLHSYKNNIVSYLNLLDILINAFVNETMLYQINLPTNAGFIYLRNFYVDDKGNYIDEIAMTKTFISKAGKFLTLYEECEKKNNKSFIVEKNLFLTQNLVGNIILLCEAINSINKD